MSKVNPKIDLVFKKIFGTEENKDLLKSLINSVLPDKQKINTITIKNPYNEIDFIGDKAGLKLHKMFTYTTSDNNWVPPLMSQNRGIKTYVQRLISKLGYGGNIAAFFGKN